MSVVRLVEKTNKETIEMLEWMLHEAKRGRLTDTAHSFRHAGLEKAAFTGAYKADTSKALMAIMRVSMMLTSHDAVHGAR